MKTKTKIQIEQRIVDNLAVKKRKTHTHTHTHTQSRNKNKKSSYFFFIWNQKKKNVQQQQTLIKYNVCRSVVKKNHHQHHVIGPF